MSCLKLELLHTQLYYDSRFVAAHSDFCSVALTNMHNSKGQCPLGHLAKLYEEGMFENPLMSEFQKYL